MADVQSESSCWNEIGVWSEQTPSCERLTETTHCQNCDVYSRAGRVPQPGIVILGRVTGDVSMFDRPGPVTIRVERMK